MNYETIRNIAKNCHENRHPYPGACDYLEFFEILRQDGYKILRGFCDYLAEKL